MEHIFKIRNENGSTDKNKSIRMVISVLKMPIKFMNEGCGQKLIQVSIYGYEDNKLFHQQASLSSQIMIVKTFNEGVYRMIIEFKNIKQNDYLLRFFIDSSSSSVVRLCKIKD